jgi:CDGSH-type Zn-finger protein
VPFISGLLGGFPGLMRPKLGGLPKVAKGEHEMTNAKITVKADGPYVVKGDIELFDTAGNPFPKSEYGYALCRCGESGNKPFCDGTHAKVGFQAATQAPAPGSGPVA